MCAAEPVWSSVGSGEWSKTGRDVADVSEEMVGGGRDGSERERVCISSTRLSRMGSIVEGD